MGHPRHAAFLVRFPGVILGAALACVPAPAMSFGDGSLPLVAASSSAEIAHQASGAAAVEGIVTLPQRPPPPAPNPRYQLKTSGIIGPPDPPSAVVFVETATQSSVLPKRAEMGQRHYQFAPGLLPIQRGATVAFPNFDDEYHSVFSYSKPKRFDLGRYHKDEPPAELVFDQPGLVKLFCEIHDHMRGHILVLDTPYFQKTAPDGRYRLEGLPAGRLVLKAWVDEGTEWERPVDLVEGKTLRVDLP
jgi:plastocyanin